MLRCNNGVTPASKSQRAGFLGDARMVGMANHAIANGTTTDPAAPTPCVDKAPAGR
jgi:hypothetical protein